MRAARVGGWVGKARATRRCSQRSAALASRASSFAAASPIIAQCARCNRTFDVLDHVLGRSAYVQSACGIPRLNISQQGGITFPSCQRGHRRRLRDSKGRSLAFKTVLSVSSFSIPQTPFTWPTMRNGSTSRCQAGVKSPEASLLTGAMGPRVCRKRQRNDLSKPGSSPSLHREPCDGG